MLAAPMFAPAAALVALPRLVLTSVPASRHASAKASRVILSYPLNQLPPTVASLSFPFRSHRCSVAAKKRFGLPTSRRVPLSPLVARRCLQFPRCGAKAGGALAAVCPWCAPRGGPSRPRVPALAQRTGAHRSRSHRLPFLSGSRPCWYATVSVAARELRATPGRSRRVRGRRRHAPAKRSLTRVARVPRRLPVPSPTASVGALARTAVRRLPKRLRAAEAPVLFAATFRRPRRPRITMLGGEAVPRAPRFPRTPRVDHAERSSAHTIAANKAHTPRRTHGPTQRRIAHGETQTLLRSRCGDRAVTRLPRAQPVAQSRKSKQIHRNERRGCRAASRRASKRSSDVRSCAPRATARRLRHARKWRRGNTLSTAMRMEQQAGTISAGAGDAQASATDANAEEKEQRPREQRRNQQGCSGALAGKRGVALRRASGEKRRVLRVASACAPTDHSGQHHHTACQCRTEEPRWHHETRTRKQFGQGMNTHLNDAVDAKR
ncbi:hypothetical protein ERJ75_000620600 [Trypanosoma vivax]|nr:hypothetical protein ERJ75_000620600 [Trypanosoma vivax]